MISFGPTEEQELVRETMQEFAAQVLRPAAREADEASHVPEDLLQQVWDLGLTSIQLPEAYGGGGEPRSPVTNALVLEELAHGDVTLAMAAASPSLFALPIADFGTESQKEAYLPLFCTERLHAASLALIEPVPAFDVLALRATAEAKGDGFVLRGRKSFVPLGDRASHFLVVARNSARASEGLRALDAFIVPRDAAGLRISEPEKNLGLRALATVSLDLEAVEVPGEARLGGADGIDAARLIASARTAQAALLVGLSRAVMDYAIPYAKERVAFDEPIARKQAIAFTLSDMRVETDAMRWLTWKAASFLERGLPATREATFAVRYAAEQSMRIADHGVQVLGGHGFIREHPVEMWYRNARTLGVLEGAATV
jgi:acyl-CoA dehydrogenase